MRLLIVFLCFALMACSNEEPKLGGDSSSTSPGGPEVSSLAPLAIKISTKYSGFSTYAEHTFAETGTATCSSTVGTPAATCTVTIPEGQLYYSNLIISFSWATEDCPLLTFVPYSYRMATTVGFYPPATGVSTDCTGIDSLSNKACWGGPGTQLVDDFPKFKGMVYVPDIGQESGATSISLDITSASDAGTGSNRHTVNDIVDKTAARSIADLGNVGDAYIANSMVDYTWQCRDKWYDPKAYSITLKIKDKDSEGATGPINNILTWTPF